MAVGDRRPLAPPEPLTIEKFRYEVQDKLGVVFHGVHTDATPRAINRKQCEDFLVERYAELVAAGEARAAALHQESEGRRRALLEKADELRAEWIRAEKAEAAIVSLQAERDAAIALLHGNPPIPDELTLPEKIASVINSRDRLQATNDLLDDLLQHDRGQLTVLQAQLQAITQEMRQVARDELVETDAGTWAERLEALGK